MSFGACTELLHCFSGLSIRSTSQKSGCSQSTISCSSYRFLASHRFVKGQDKQIAKYNQVFCMSTDRVVAQDLSNNQGLTYKDAGVDIDAGSKLVCRIAKMAPGIGGLVPRGDSYLVARTDGVGTKVMLAFETGIYDTIGIDLVAMSVNDIVTSGAKPMFFLDYFATGRLDVNVAEMVIKGIVEGCRQSDCALLGGETAEMPGLYKDGKYDLSGCAVGIVKKDSVIDGKNIVAGDVLIGLPSSGVHSNGFSLVRRVLAQSDLSLKDKLPGGDVTIAEALMAPTVIYVKQVLELISKGGVKGMAHITGGGFTDNIPRVFPEGLGAVIYKDSWDVPPIFKWLQQAGNIEDSEMRRTFNMGVGMVLVVSPETSHRILEDTQEPSKVYCIGEVISSNGVSYSGDYGAKGDGQTDDSQAFLKVWKDVCGATEGTPTLLIPQGKTFLLQPINFKGPCKSASFIVQLQGDLVAPRSKDAWEWPDDDKDYWIKFSNTNGLLVSGGGTIDGQGAPWWQHPDDRRPTNVRFTSCQTLQVSDLKNINSPGSHMLVNGCNGSHISNLYIVAPEDSPNTDGIDVSELSNVTIQHSRIATGDECIAINGGSCFINITGIACGPGHGISIGSLGGNKAYATVEEIHIKNCSFNGTQNGVRIKTWEGGSGYARKITFTDIKFIAARNPVIIDQHHSTLENTSNSAVNVSDITYNRVSGTSAVEYAIQLNCDNLIGCTNIVMQDIDIVSSVPGKNAYASCNNAHGTYSSSTPSIPCLDHV